MLETFVSTFSGRVLISKKVRDEIRIKETEENPLIVKLIEDEKIRVSKVNPVRNSSGALNPVRDLSLNGINPALRGGTPYGAEPGIILKSNPAAKQRCIISNGVKNGKLIKKLMDDFNIEIGEAEAIVLALQEKASIVATGDRNAIRACKILKIDFTTAIAILIRAFENDLIDKDEALIKLRKLDSVARYRREIVEDARGRIEGGDGHVNKNT